MIMQFLKDFWAMHWVPKLILILVVLKTVAIMVREAQIF